MEEYCDGGCLKDYLDTLPSPPNLQEDIVAYIGESVLNGLVCLHNIGYMHRGALALPFQYTAIMPTCLPLPTLPCRHSGSIPLATTFHFACSVWVVGNQGKGRPIPKPMIVQM